MTHDGPFGRCCEHDPPICHDPVPHRRLLIDASGFLAASVLPIGIVRGQGASRKLVDTHHHFFPPPYQKAWPGNAIRLISRLKDGTLR